MDSGKSLKSHLIKICEIFNRNKVKYILIGGFAVILYGFPRITEDIDFMIENSDENIERIKTSLFELFKDSSFKEITTKDFDSYAVIRYGTPENFYIDFISKIGEYVTFEEVYKNKKVKVIEGVEIPIISSEDLYNLKRNTIRVKDKIDAKFLKYILTNINKKE